METNTFTAVAGAVIVLFGVYALFTFLKYLADLAIFLIAMADAFAAFNIHLWYNVLAKTIVFLPPVFDFRGWAISIGILTALGALLALPILPFSSVIETTAWFAAKRRQRLRNKLEPPRTNTGPNASPAEKMFNWDNINDW